MSIDHLPKLDECRYLILKMVEQAVRDYLALEHSAAPIDRFYYESACQFLFDDDFIVDYGGSEKTLSDLLDIIGIELDWFRERVVKLKDIRVRDQRMKRSNHVGYDEENLEWD